MYHMHFSTEIYGLTRTYSGPNNGMPTQSQSQSHQGADEEHIYNLDIAPRYIFFRSSKRSTDLCAIPQTLPTFCLNNVSVFNNDQYLTRHLYPRFDKKSNCLIANCPSGKQVDIDMSFENITIVLRGCSQLIR